MTPQTIETIREALECLRDKLNADGEPHEYYQGIIDDELAKLDTTKRCSATDSWATGERFACRLAKDHGGACDFGATDEDYRRAASQAPKFFANENELRGSYFCTEFPFRPYLHVGHDVEFDDIPRLLKLGRNDIIEVRVVERVKP